MKSKPYVIRTWLINRCDRTAYLLAALLRSQRYMPEGSPFPTTSEKRSELLRPLVKPVTAVSWSAMGRLSGSHPARTLNEGAVQYGRC